MTPALLLVAAVAAAPAIDCDQLHADIAPAALQLDYQTFDQTPGQGFRVLAEASCPRQAADLIETYVAQTGATEHSLRWHVAQLRGESGQPEAALSAARASLRANEAPDVPFRWNAHVRAYIAFLESDRESFDTALTELDTHAEAHRGNRMNADFWRRLAPHFERGYAAAVKQGMTAP
jgi:hypothetical protein